MTAQRNVVATTCYCTGIGDKYKGWRIEPYQRELRIQQVTGHQDRQHLHQAQTHVERKIKYYHGGGIHTTGAFGIGTPRSRHTKCKSHVTQSKLRATKALTTTTHQFVVTIGLRHMRLRREQIGDDTRRLR